MSRRFDTTPACVSRDVELFFTPGYEQAAIRVCEQCPIREQCLAEAMSVERPSLRFGVFGGLTPEQRTELWRTTRACADCGQSLVGEAVGRKRCEACQAVHRRESKRAWRPEVAA